MRGARTIRPIASDLLEDGWLPPHSAAAAHDISEPELRRRAEQGEIRRKQIARGFWLYEVPR